MENNLNLLRIVKRKIKTYAWLYDVKLKQIINSKKCKNDQWIVFDTSIGSQNLGDEIIQLYCKKELNNLIGSTKLNKVSTHFQPNKTEQQMISTTNNKIVCGTNLMTPHFEEFSNWKMPFDLDGYSNIITMGVGWGYYCDDISKISKFVYKTILSKTMIHSVRDSYTEKKFKEMGITNVINTGCPTLWGLTEEHCDKINKKKSKYVVTTLTDYSKDEKNDKYMLDILKKQYDEVYVWIQGTEDYQYLSCLTNLDSVKVIERDLNSYTKILKTGDVDYVGTRLHAGIHALNHFVRTIIIAVDNRAIEMGKDFHLPVIKREEIYEKLDNMINNEYITNIYLPLEEIEKWRNQFKGGSKNVNS